MNDFVGLGGHKFQIALNYDENPILISAFIVLVNTFRISITIGGDIGWDVGNMGDGLTYYDPNWKAKSRR